MTLFFVPHLAFGGEVSKDYHERPTINEERVNSKPIAEYSCTQHALLWGHYNGVYSDAWASLDFLPTT